MRGGATDHQGRLRGIWFCPARNRPIPQVERGSFSHQRFLLFRKKCPTCEAGDNQYARGDGEDRSGAPASILSLERRKISVTRAAGPQVIEPLLRFRERRLMGSDFLEHVGPWTPGTAGIRKLLEQASAQGTEDAPFVLRGISLCVQVRLTLSINSEYTSS
jgi:hypothetical protein